MKENVFDNPVELRSAVSPPRFEDRRVVMRAERVVPLAEIRTKLRLRKLLYLGGAFAIAIVLGAATALIAVHVQRSGATKTQIQLTNNTETETADTADTQAAVAGGPVHPAPQTDAALSEDEASLEPVVKPVVEAKRQTPPPAERPRIVAGQNQPLEPRDRDRDRGVEPSDEEQLEQIRESVLYDQWQERRMRRAARRERRRNRDGRDLSRIDELFEGPRRPERPY